MLFFWFIKIIDNGLIKLSTKFQPLTPLQATDFAVVCCRQVFDSRVILQLNMAVVVDVEGNLRTRQEVECIYT
jgi:hypothetical protein